MSAITVEATATRRYLFGVRRALQPGDHPL